jgi:hypothetical protein
MRLWKEEAIFLPLINSFMGSFGSHFCQVCRFVYPKLKKTDFFPAENSSFVFEKIIILIVFQEYF